MAILSFKLDQLFMLLVPELVVFIPNEPDFFQKFLSINSKFVIVMKCTLRMNPIPQRLILLVVRLWHLTIAIRSFKLDQLFILLVPELVVWFVGTVGAVRFPREPDFVQTFLSIKSKFVVDMISPLRVDPPP
jgi:hypothetical protein